MSILHNLPLKLIELCGVPITISKDYKGEWYLDFNTGMKSELHLYYINGKYIAKCRYDKEYVIEDFHDFHHCLCECMAGRTFMNAAWVDIYEDGFGEFTYDNIIGETK